MKKRLYPAKLRVGATTYRLELVPHIEEIGRNVTRGYCDPDEKLITLLEKQSDKELFSTFIHELLHAIEYEHKVKIPHKLVYAMEGPLAQALTKNFYIIPRR